MEDDMGRINKPTRHALLCVANRNVAGYPAVHHLHRSYELIACLPLGPKGATASIRPENIGCLDQFLSEAQCLFLPCDADPVP